MFLFKKCFSAGVISYFTAVITSKILFRHLHGVYSKFPQFSKPGAGNFNLLVHTNFFTNARSQPVQDVLNMFLIFGHF